MLRFHIYIHCVFLILFSNFINASNSIPADVLFKQPDISSMSLSPEGKYLLEVGRTDEKRILNLIDTSSLKKYRILAQSFKQSSTIKDYIWLDDNTLYVEEENSAFSFLQQKKSNTFIVKINDSATPLQVLWKKIPVDGYVVSSKIEQDGDIIFAKTVGEFKDSYQLYKMTVDELLANDLGFFKKYRTKLNKARYFTQDPLTKTLIGYTYKNEQINTWYLPVNKSSWKPVYHHDLEDEFTPLSFISSTSLAVLTNKNSNLTYVAEFDIKQQKFTRVIYQHPSHDLINATLTSDGEMHSITYIKYGAHNTEYLSVDGKKIKQSLLNNISGRKVIVIDETEELSLVLAHSSDTPGELYLFNKKLNKLNSLGKLRKNLSDYVLAKAEVFNVLLDDGTSIEGIVTNPSVKSNGVLLVNPHGGPIGVRDNAAFNLEHQFYASRGYTVLNVNFRGSTGFGKAFEDKGREQFGQLIEEDIMAVYRSFIQGKSFDYTCSMGSSYGGYSAVMLAIKHPENFQCAISTFGVFDLPHLFNATNLRTLPENKKGLIRVMGEDATKLKAISPITLAHELNVPVLIMAGKNDSIAPFEQSNRMKYVLEKLEKNVDFHAYENTGHGHHNWTGDRHEHNAIDGFIQGARAGFYQMLKAFNNKDISKVKTLLDNLQDINIQDRKGDSFLHYAIELEDEDFASQVIELLLHFNINIDLKNDAVQTPLYLAALYNKVKLVKLLLNNGANVNTQNHSQWTPLFIAASEGYLDVAIALLKYDVDLSFATDSGWNALMYTAIEAEKSVHKMQEEIAQLLLEKGIRSNIRTSNGLTVLMMASYNGNIPLIKLLVESGVDIIAENHKQKNKTALDYAIQREQEVAINYLQPITEQANYDVNKPLEDFTFQLRIKSISGALAVIPYLTNINQTDKEGKAAIHYAVELKNDEHSILLLDNLIANGANLDVKTKNERSILYNAVSHNRIDLVKYLLKNGADINLRGSKGGWTPLFIAASKGYVEIVREMMAYSPDISLYSLKSGWTALFYATNSFYKAKDTDQAEIAQILIDNGADITTRNYEDMTTLMNAAENGKFEVLKILVNAGADINVSSSQRENKTVLEIAVDNGHSEIVNYLKKLI